MSSVLVVRNRKVVVGVVRLLAAAAAVVVMTALVVTRSVAAFPDQVPVIELDDTDGRVADAPLPGIPWRPTTEVRGHEAPVVPQDQDDSTGGSRWVVP